jgi:hypothetical protein
VLLGPVEGRVNHLAGREALVVGVADGATDRDLAADAVNRDPGDLVGLVAHVGVGQVHAVQPVHVQLSAKGVDTNKSELVSKMAKFNGESAYFSSVIQPPARLMRSLSSLRPGLCGSLISTCRNTHSRYLRFS